MGASEKVNCVGRGSAGDGGGSAVPRLTGSRTMLRKEFWSVSNPIFGRSFHFGPSITTTYFGKKEAHHHTSKKRLLAVITASVAWKKNKSRTFFQEKSSSSSLTSTPRKHSQSCFKIHSATLSPIKPIAGPPIRPRHTPIHAPHNSLFQMLP